MLRVENLSLGFGRGRGASRVLDRVSFRVDRGQSFGLVGESGSGKTTLLNCLCGLHRHWQGRIVLDGVEVAGDRPRPERLLRRVQMVFQDPFGSLHPRHTVDRALKELIAIHRLGDADRRVVRVLDEVGLGAKFRFRYPHQLSGGQRQRVAVARALLPEPQLLLLDEPTSALDLSVQAEILNLLRQIRSERGLTCLLVSHDLAVVSHLCSEICVIRRGEVVEQLDRAQLGAGEFCCDYTRKLFAAALYQQACRPSNAG